MRRATGLVLLLSLLLAACTSTGGPPHPPQRQRSITVDLATAPTTLNPIHGFAPDGGGQFYDGLLEHRADGRLEPALATQLPRPDAAGTHWTVPVRSGVRFSDGSRLRPADVVATYRAVIEAGAPGYANLRAVHVTPDRQVRFTLEHKDPDFARSLVLGIAPAKAVHAGKLDTRPVGAGPFEFTGRHGDELTMRARDDYWGTKPKLDTVTVRFQPDEAKRVADLRSGKADAARVGNEWRAKPPDGTKAVASHSAGYRAITLPAGNPVTADPGMRKAMNLAVDRNALVADQLHGIGEAASTPVTDPEYQDASAEFRFDKPAAEALLNKDGWHAAPGAVRAKHGTEAAFTLRYPGGDPTAKRLATAFAERMRAIGVRVRPVAGKAGEDEAAVVALGDPFTPQLGPRTPAVAEAVRTARTQTDPTQRAIAYRAVDRAYVRSPSMVVLARMQHTYLVAERFHGYQPVREAAEPGLGWGLFGELEDWTM